MQASPSGDHWNRFEATCTELDAKQALVYALSGTFTDSKEAYEFLDDLRERARQGTGPIVLDLSDVQHMTSCGVGILAACYTSAANANRSLRIAGMSKRAEAVMRIVGLLAVIPRFASREDALSATTS